MANASDLLILDFDLLADFCCCFEHFDSVLPVKCLKVLTALSSLSLNCSRL